MATFGLDFGTTFSTVSVVTSSGYLFFQQNDSAYIPTSLFFFPSGGVCFGYQADKNFISKADGSYFRDLKRYVGCTSRTIGNYLTKLRPHYRVTPVKVGYGVSDTVSLSAYNEAGADTFDLPFLIATYVSRLIETAEEAFRCKCSSLIVSVPAGYSCSKRLFMEACVSLSGYQCRAMLNEPSAAAIAALPHLSPTDSLLLVYDFGGGTFDVSLATVVGSTIAIKDSSGDMNLGGRDIDRALSDWIKSRAGVITPEPLDVSALKEALSISSETLTYTLDVAGNPQVRISPSDLAEIARPFIDRSIAVVLKLLKSSKFRSLKPKVVLVGGSSALPGLSQLITQMPSFSGVVEVPDARGAVSAGCALFVRSFDATSDMHLVDCVTVSVSVCSLRGMAVCIVPKGSPLPFVGSKSITLENLTRSAPIIFKFFEGESTRVVYNDPLFAFEFYLKDWGLDAWSISSLKVTIHTEVSSVGEVSLRLSAANSSLDMKPSKLYDFPTPSKPIPHIVNDNREKLDSIKNFIALASNPQARNNNKALLSDTSVLSSTPSHVFIDTAAAGPSEFDAAELVLRQTVPRNVRSSTVRRVPFGG
uniref:Putative heat shock protein 70 n=1 Tax=Fig mild mottle-associated virus TaxID=666641 RepID=D3GBB2_9CLOS|nr:putative heat shock protein 70 [Fig mild mottle-associated virus]